MKVSLGMPFWGNDQTRLRNFSYVLPVMQSLYEWHDVQTLTPIGVETRGGARNYLVSSLSDGGADVVVLCDADTFVEPGALTAAIGLASAGGLHFPYDGYRYLTDWSTVRLMMKDYSEIADLPMNMIGPGSLGGCMVIRPDQWWEAGGSPEFEGWGFEDVVFAIQARSLLRSPTTWTPGWLTHLYHPDECHVGSPSYERNIAVCRAFEAADGDPEAIRRLIAERLIGER